jgi:prolyl 4-hydroxylase
VTLNKMATSTPEPVQIIDSFLSQEECQYIIETFKDRLVGSLVLHEGVRLEQHPSRTSSTYFLPNNDKTVVAVKMRAAEFLKIPTENVETLQLLRYTKGERYLYHHDYLAGNPANQRVHTIIVYLNDLAKEDGGATSFYYYKQSVTPKMGRGVWFRNMDENGRLIYDSMHAGEEIKTDAVKYAINIWTRQSRW